MVVLWEPVALYAVVKPAVARRSRHRPVGLVKSDIVIIMGGGIQPVGTYLAQFCAYGRSADNGGEMTCRRACRLITYGGLLGASQPWTRPDNCDKRAVHLGVQRSWSRGQKCECGQSTDFSCNKVASRQKQALKPRLEVVGTVTIMRVNS